MVIFVKSETNQTLMKNELVLLATFTYAHEAVFIKTALAEKGIRYFIKTHPPLISNNYYDRCEAVEQIYIHQADTKQALSLLHYIKPDSHIKNRCTTLHTCNLNNTVEATQDEKGFCWVCYSLMIGALGVSVYAILNAILFVF